MGFLGFFERALLFCGSSCSRRRWFVSETRTRKNSNSSFVVRSLGTAPLGKAVQEDGFFLKPQSGSEQHLKKKNPKNRSVVSNSEQQKTAVLLLWFVRNYTSE